MFAASGFLPFVVRHLFPVCGFSAERFHGVKMLLPLIFDGSVIGGYEDIQTLTS